ncbi:helix-turn-helix domain-containing protein [Pedobacter sp. L105]|uniref:winged helix-turn-helix transcriptional regulator n=1 Tax=Pedobacter sp. L105 TaxID=1641871 RepID=UPI0020B175E6|nr:helix-turn-helix domain-containing protein [Pedobacter sp. L105]
MFDSKYQKRGNFLLETINIMNNRAITKKFSAHCKSRRDATQYTINLLAGKWKLNILISLDESPKHFMELQRSVSGIGPKMLSQELRILEENELVDRTVLDTSPVSVKYELTAYGETLRGLIMGLQEWGFKHQDRVKRSFNQLSILEKVS